MRRGEALAHAVEREVLEETALEVTCGALRGWAERISPGYHYVILDFDVAVRGQHVPEAGTDATEVAWVPLSEVASIEAVSGLVAFLQEHGVLR